MDASPALPSASLLADAVAIRLADEGIPVRAIARAVHLPSDEVYGVLRVAIEQGTIVEMPKDDWPPGSNRRQRSVIFGTILDDEDALRNACARFFKATPLEAALLATLLRRDQASKDQLHHVVETSRRGELNKKMTDPKMVDVMICKLRKKLRDHDIYIETMWGTGYLIPSALREKAIQLLLASVS